MLSKTNHVFDFHVHSMYSDGRGSIEEIAKKAKERGLRVIAIADHSIEHPLGLDEGKARRRKQEIELCQDRFGLRILDAVECGIDADGRIEKPKHDFELVIASIHESLPAEEYCKRVIKCAKTQEFDVLGHYRSSIFGVDEGIGELDLEVIDVLIENEIALELNTAHLAPPSELLDVLKEEGLAKKLVYSVGSDSHSVERVGDVKWAVETLNTKLGRWKSLLEVLE